MPSSYTALARELPRPSESQIDAFVKYFASAHSWYKHLPLFPPASRFVFFLDPNAGRDQIQTARGMVYQDRATETPAEKRFHYTWRPTADYILSFGHIQYFADVGTSFLYRTADGVVDTRRLPRVQDGDGRWVELPDEIQTAGEVYLTASIHRLGQKPVVWLERTYRIESYYPNPEPIPADVPHEDDLARVADLLRGLPMRGPARRSTGEALTRPRPSPSAEIPRDRLKAMRVHLENHAAVQRERIRNAIRGILDVRDS